MDAGLADQEARLLAEVGLAGEVGVGAAAVARAKIEADVVGRADRPVRELPTRLAVPGLEAEVLVHDDERVGDRRPPDDARRRREILAERLLADRRDPAFDAEPEQRLVGGGRG